MHVRPLLLLRPLPVQRFPGRNITCCVASQVSSIYSLFLGHPVMSDEVSRNTIWKEHCVKDQKHATLNTTFCIGDPRKSATPPSHDV